MSSQLPVPLTRLLICWLNMKWKIFSTIRVPASFNSLPSFFGAEMSTCKLKVKGREYVIILSLADEAERKENVKESDNKKLGIHLTFLRILVCSTGGGCELLISVMPFG